MQGRGARWRRRWRCIGYGARYPPHELLGSSAFVVRWHGGAYLDTEERMLHVWRYLSRLHLQQRPNGSSIGPCFGETCRSTLHTSSNSCNVISWPYHNLSSTHRPCIIDVSRLRRGKRRSDQGSMAAHLGGRRPPPAVPHNAPRMHVGREELTCSSRLLTPIIPCDRHTLHSGESARSALSRRRKFDELLSR